LFSTFWAKGGEGGLPAPFGGARGAVPSLVWNVQRQYKGEVASMPVKKKRLGAVPARGGCKPRILYPGGVPVLLREKGHKE